jgi:hypothetical protein
MRNDIHRPSAIQPEDYEYVAVWTMNIQGFGDCRFMMRERETVKRHMDRTSGTYANVVTTGSCQICGNVQAIFLALFYHAESNQYLKVGVNCAQKLGLSLNQDSMNNFRRNLADAREAQAGKRKAIAILGDLNLISAWEIFTEEYPKHAEDCAVKDRFNEVNGNGYSDGCTCNFVQNVRAFDQFPEHTTRDIVGKLVQYGSVSEKQIDFLRKLAKQIIDRPIIQAQRQAESDAAGPVPTGRTQMTGVVLSVKTVERETRFYGDAGLSTKVLIKLENGSKVYGNRFQNVEKGDTVTFVATVTQSDRDPKFGFFKRPTLPKRELSKDEKKATAKLRRIQRSIPYDYEHSDSHTTLDKLIQEISA